MSCMSGCVMSDVKGGFRTMGNMGYVRRDKWMSVLMPTNKYTIDVPRRYDPLARWM